MELTHNLGSRQSCVKQYTQSNARTLLRMDSTLNYPLA
uniref:Uncharacterized protein n=1 Tax=Anguilla anguilla TaxID=7936 RepID=A0A0E9VWC9_ANGAN